MTAAQRDIDFAIAEHNLAPEKDTLSLFALALTELIDHATLERTKFLDRFTIS